MLPQGRVRRHVLRIIVVSLFAMIWLCGQVRPVAGDEAVQILGATHQVHFGKDITFDLQFGGAGHVREVTLYYTREGEGVTVRVPVPIPASGQPVSYTWELQPGDLPVGEGIEYFWRIVDDQGNQLETASFTVEYNDDRFDWQVLEESSIVLFWYGSSESEARRLLDLASGSLARLQDEMGVHLDQPVHIYVYRTKSDMSLALSRRSDAFDDRILTLGVVVDDATLLLLGTHPDVKGTIAHELSHIVVGLATQNPYVSLPRWLDEGLAMYAEGELPSGNRRALDNAIQQDQLISVRSLSAYTGNPAEVDLFYGEAYSLVDYLLRTYGKDKMSELLASFTAGITQDQALRQVYDLGVPELDAAWRHSLGLAPRGTPQPATPVPQSAPQRPGFPCPTVALVGLLGAAATAHGRTHARAS